MCGSDRDRRIGMDDVAAHALRGSSAQDVPNAFGMSAPLAYVLTCPAPLRADVPARLPADVLPTFLPTCPFA
jgi:hypothetical protein